MRQISKVSPQALYVNGYRKMKITLNADAESWYAAAVACRCDLGDRETQYEILQKALLCNNKHVNRWSGFQMNESTTAESELISITQTDYGLQSLRLWSANAGGI